METVARALALKLWSLSNSSVQPIKAAKGVRSSCETEETTPSFDFALATAMSLKRLTSLTQTSMHHWYRKARHPKNKSAIQYAPNPAQSREASSSVIMF